MTIKHLIISGGGPLGFSYFGCLDFLKTQNYISFNELISIYSTSVGTIIATIIALNFESSIINDYFINRPWKDAYKLNGKQILNFFENKGLFDEEFFIIIFKPLFDSKNIDININLKEFNELIKINLYFFAFDLNNYETIELNHKNYPQLKLISAIKMSCSFPGIIIPSLDFEKDKCIIDGGILDNFPLKYCLRDNNNYEEILGLNQDNNYNNILINENSNILDFISSLLMNSINYINKIKDEKKENNENNEINNNKFVSNEKIKIIYFKNKHSKINLWINALTSSNFRKELVDDGYKIAQLFLNNLV